MTRERFFKIADKQGMSFEWAEDVWGKLKFEDTKSITERDVYLAIELAKMVILMSVHEKAKMN